MKINSYSINEIKGFLLNGYKLYLYGAGDAVSSYARITNAALRFEKIDFECFFDDDETRIGKKFLDKEIISSSRMDKVHSKAIVLISSNYFKTILRGKIITKEGVVISSLVRLLEDTKPEAFSGLMSYEELLRRLHTHKSKLQQLQGFQDLIYVNALDVQVTEKCTMKCKDCSNLMQYYGRPVHADMDNLVTSLEKFIEAIDHLADARVIGGEPFMVKELPKILNFLTKSNKVGHITIYTNGTIVPNDEVINSLKSQKIVVEITDYNEYSRNLKKLSNVMKINGIKYFSHRPQNWTDSARIVQNKKNSSQLSQMFDACCVNDAITLLHGRIYHCPFSANIINLNAIKVSEEEFIDLSLFNDSAKLRQHFNKWYFGRPFLESCAYCLGRDYMQPKVEPGVQTKKVFEISVARG
jgi:MoaA/NifB/PqqE/SkfB family radical SAM enzyme